MFHLMYEFRLLFRFIFGPALVNAGQAFPSETQMEKKPYLRPAKEFTVDKKALANIAEALGPLNASRSAEENVMETNFKRVANQIYKRLGRPKRTVKNGWKIWEAMYLAIDLARAEIWDTSSLDSMDHS